MKVLTANAVRMSNAISAIRVYRSARRHFTVDLIHSSNLSLFQNTTVHRGAPVPGALISAHEVQGLRQGSSCK